MRRVARWSWRCSASRRPTTARMSNSGPSSPSSSAGSARLVQGPRARCSTGWRHWGRSVSRRWPTWPAKCATGASINRSSTASGPRSMRRRKRIFRGFHSLRKRCARRSSSGWSRVRSRSPLSCSPTWRRPTRCRSGRAWSRRCCAATTGSARWSPRPLSTPGACPARRRSTSCGAGATACWPLRHPRPRPRRQSGPWRDSPPTCRRAAR